MSIRSATAADVPAIIAVELSAGTLFEGTHMAWAVGETSTVAQLLELIDRRLVWVSEIDGSVAGYLSGEPLDGAFHIEEVAVSRAHHRQGVGRALLAYLATLACARGHGRLEWSVLDWNEPAIRFYASLGATPMDAWTRFRLVGDPLVALAARGRV